MVLLATSCLWALIGVRHILHQSAPGKDWRHTLDPLFFSALFMLTITMLAVGKKHIPLS